AGQTLPSAPPRNRTLQMRTRLPVPPHSGSAHPLITIRVFASGDERGLRQIFIRAIEGLTAADYDHRQRAAWAGAATDIIAWNARIQAPPAFHRDARGRDGRLCRPAGGRTHRSLLRRRRTRPARR